jgi:hypothetical protein
MVAGERVDVVGEVFLRAAETVHQEQTGGRDRAGGTNRELDSVVRPHLHAGQSTRAGWKPGEPVT